MLLTALRNTIVIFVDPKNRPTSYETYWRISWRWEIFPYTINIDPFASSWCTVEMGATGNWSLPKLGNSKNMFWCEICEILSIAKALSLSALTRRKLTSLRDCSKILKALLKCHYSMFSSAHESNNKVRPSGSCRSKKYLFLNSAKISLSLYCNRGKH